MKSTATAELRVGPLTNIEKVLRSLDCEPEPVFSRAGFTAAEFADPEHRIDFHAGDALLNECVRATGCSHFGLLLGQSSLARHLGLVTELSQCAPSIEAALVDIVNYLDLHDTGGIAAIERSSSSCTFSYALHVESLQATEVIYDLAALMLCNIMRGLCGVGWSPTAAYLARSQPSDPTPYRRYLRAPLHFDATATYLVFPLEQLGRMPLGADEARHNTLQADAVRQLNSAEPQLTRQVRDLIRRNLLAGSSDVEDVAAPLNLHERTLHRRLRAEGTTYREQLDSVRFAVGQHYLAGTEMSVGDIAHALGYSSIASFDHAFKRWAAVSPKHWRRDFITQHTPAQ